MMSKEEIKQYSMNSLERSLNKIYEGYSKIYDLYHDEENEPERDVYFIHDMVDAIQGIEAVLEVYTRDNHINPGYACEKLNYSINLLQYIKKYFEEKGDKNDRD